MSLPVRLKPYAQLLATAFDPGHIGLWSGPHAFFFGSLDTTMHAHQLPASTLHVAALMVALLAFFVARELIGFARAGLKRQTR